MLPLATQFVEGTEPKSIVQKLWFLRNPVSQAFNEPANAHFLFF
jgi:hypothetical protein